MAKTVMQYSSKSHAKNLGHKKSHGNPSNLHSSRKGSTVRKPKSSSAGLQGLSVGQKVPMDMFKSQPKYTKPNPHGMPQVIDANAIKRKTKSALGGKQQRFFGL